MIGLLNGSPKAAGGTSGAILTQMQGELDAETAVFSARDRKEDTYVQLNRCKTVIIAFPIYADALPSHLLQFLMGWEAHRKRSGSSDCRVYAVSHAGFHDGIQCRWSLDLLRNFCSRSGLIWGGGAGMGGAAILGESGGVPAGALKPLRHAVSLLAQNARSGDTLPENRFVNVGMPRWLYKSMGNMGWKQRARKNKLSQKDLLRQE